MPSADRETGGVAVDVVGAGEIAGREPRGLEPADAADLGDIVAGQESPSMVAFQFMPLRGSEPRSLTVNVSRYTAQAVLVANVEEARYDALLGEDGKLLVRARYAVRNNQRSFLAVTLPPQSDPLERLARGPAGPPRACRPSGGLLLPLRKGRTNEEAPTFVVELLYLQRAAGMDGEGRRAPRVAGRRSAGVADRFDPAPLAALRRRCETGRVPARTRSRSVERGAARRHRRPRRGADITGMARGRSRHKDLKALMDRFQKEAGPHPAGGHPDRDRLSCDRPVDVSRRGADA